MTPHVKGFFAEADMIVTGDCLLGRRGILVELSHIVFAERYRIGESNENPWERFVSVGFFFANMGNMLYICGIK